METIQSNSPANLILTSFPLSDLREVIRETVNESVSQIIERINTQPQPTAPAPEKDNDKLLRVEDVIKLLGVSKMTLHLWRKKGKLAYYKIGKIVYFKEHEVLESLRKFELGK